MVHISHDSVMHPTHGELEARCIYIHVTVSWGDVSRLQHVVLWPYCSIPTCYWELLHLASLRLLTCSTVLPPLCMPSQTLLLQCQHLLNRLWRKSLSILWFGLLLRLRLATNCSRTAWTARLPARCCYVDYSTFGKDTILIAAAAGKTLILAVPLLYHNHEYLHRC